MKKGIILAELTFFTAAVAMFQPTGISRKISPAPFGLFFEDTNYSSNAGLYAELVQNRSFEYNPTEQKGWNPFTFWKYFSSGYRIFSKSEV